MLLVNKHLRINDACVHSIVDNIEEGNHRYTLEQVMELPLFDVCL